MPFPRRLLTSDEELVLDLRPHWIALVGPVAATIVLAAAVILGVTHIHGHSGTKNVLRWVVAGVGVVLFIAYPVRRFIQWVTSHFVVTNERLIHRQGLIAKNSMEIPLDRINDVRFHQNVFERMIGAGDLVIESAGTRGQEVFSNVRHPENVQKVVYERSEGYTMKMQGSTPAPAAPAPATPAPAAPAPAAPAPPSVTEELQRLADLKDRGTITEEEFQAQKSRLLGGG
ncbi:MAG: PH domain-containing protein [Actinomycetota bacterium]|nr:PH domain-containing protein [Actinomycetota bacterium]